ncbi:MAG: TetR/AcrR family transcriptional regulator [Rhodobacteraceae bacterium]|nr:TetR/AcrR family transcriptional regulator [Paracoccaceae bacterium]
MKSRKTSKDRKVEILSTTLDLAFEVGPDHVTTGMIAGRLGLSQPAIYKHFPKKEDVWLAVAERLCTQIAQNVEKAGLGKRAPTDRLRTLILGQLQLISDTPALPEIMVTRDPTGALTKARRQIQSAMGDFRAALSDAFEQARLGGQFQDCLGTNDGVTLLFGVIQSLVLRLIVTRDPAVLVQDGERLLDLQLSLFRCKGDGV